MQTKLALVVTEESGHDPLMATGLVLVHLPAICKRRQPDLAQVWVLRTVEKRPQAPWEILTTVAKRQGTQTKQLYDAHKLTDEQLRASPFKAK
jgi:hypothetical protein